MSLTVHDAGLLTLVQDLGRPGLSALGVSRSGAFDRRAVQQGNALVGNPPSTAGLEILGGRIDVQAEADHLIALTGAPASATVDGDPVSHGRAIVVHRGQRLVTVAPVTGIRTYLAVAGGIAIQAVLGSAATDTLAGLGPEPVRAGDVLAVGEKRGHASEEDVPPLLAWGELTLRVVLGPRDDWFAPESVMRFLRTAWTVSPAANRVGVRLGGPVLDRARIDELPSEPCLRGSIQIAADGQPIVFGPDHPVTGGYPVIAVVVDRDTDVVGQARPGQTIRFARVPLP